MIKMVAVVNRKVGMNRREFVEYWIKKHAPLASQIPGLRKYVVSPTLDEQAPYDGIAELWFDDLSALKEGFATDLGKRAQDDLPRFTAKVTRIFTEEHQIL